MKIWKIELTKERTQLVKMPEKSEIMDIQMQNGKPVMWFLTNPESKEIEVKINMYGTGWETHESASKDEYLATVQDGELVWHFFMNYEVGS
jgi:3-polyprenyl-4-hydroxybenzoate decarboxylase